MSAFTLYNSSAGSGKTFTLTKEYLKIVLLEPWKFEHILAITFTKKAANEMKERIVSSLISLSKEPFDVSDTKALTLLEKIEEETGKPRELLLTNAKKALNNILHKYSNFGVSTIDSFINAILSGCAFRIGLSAYFRIRTNSVDYLRLALDEVLDLCSEDQKLARIFRGFLHDYLYLENRTGWFPKQNIFEETLKL